MRSNDVILQTTAKLMIFMIFCFSIYLFFAGHNDPGGGFVGGLLTTGALVLFALSFDIKTLKKVVPLRFQWVMATGLFIALLTGMGSFIFNVPFLTHTFGVYTIPVLGEIELATATLFDLGVYLAVVGSAMTIILAIGEGE